MAGTNDIRLSYAYKSLYGLAGGYSLTPSLNFTFAPFSPFGFLVVTDVPGKFSSL